MNKKVIICGDSYMSPTRNFSGTHFSEIFARELNFDLEVYAASGMSNGGIAIQLQSAIRKKPDLIIFGTTTPERVEIPLSDVDDKLYEYTRENLLYCHANDVSTEKSNQDPKLLSISLQSLLNPPWYSLGQDPYTYHHAMDRSKFDLVRDFDLKVNSLKEYFLYLYDPIIKKQIDRYMMYAIIHELHCSGIPFLWVHDSILGEHSTMETWLDSKNDLRIPINLLTEYKSFGPNFKDPGYHTDFATQQKIAEILINHYKNNFI